MMRKEFVEMVNATTFPNHIIDLFITSYDAGHRQGCIETLQQSLMKMDAALQRQSIIERQQ